MPSDVPMFITESNISSQASEASIDIFGALWLADYVGSFFTAGGDALYYFHYIPFGVDPGCNNSQSSFGMFNVNEKHEITQPLSQFFASQLINLEWLEPGNSKNQIYSADTDVEDGSGHKLVTAYAVKRPDNQWALLIVNRDQENAHAMAVRFRNVETGQSAGFVGSVDAITFGREQYRWDPLKRAANPDGPALRTKLNPTADMKVTLPASSLVVLRGQIDLK